MVRCVLGLWGFGGLGVSFRCLLFLSFGWVYIFSPYRLSKWRSLGMWFGELAERVEITVPGQIDNEHIITVDRHS